jgi:hypothetical protein
MKIKMIHAHMVAEVGQNPQLWSAGETHETSDVTAQLLINVGVAELVTAGNKDASAAKTFDGSIVPVPAPLGVVALEKAIDAPENKAIKPKAKK